MHLSGLMHNHPRVGARDMAPPLVPRDPSLITLPISIPSIPILGPILTPLIGGTNQAATTTSTPTQTYVQATTTAQSPAVTSAPTDSETSADNGSGNNGNDGSADNGSPTADGNASSASGGSNDSGSGSETATGTASSAQQSSASSSTSNDDDGNATNSTNDATSKSSSGGISNNLNAPIANAGSGVDPSSGIYTSGITGNSGAYTATAVSGKGVTGSTSLPGGPDSTSVSGGNSDSNTTGSSISKGAIAGIAVFLGLVVLAILLLLFRRRRIQRRTDRMTQWWQRAGPRLNDDSSNSNGSNRASFRSSFETTIDHARTPRLSVSFDDIPPLPPMAEIRNVENPTLPLFSPNSALADSPVLISFDTSQPTLVSSDRNSLQSVASNSTEAQYLLVQDASHGHGGDMPTPMSVRPFSPSESFSFPKPPKEKDGSSSRPMSTLTLQSGFRSVNSASSGTATAPVVPDLPSNPFSDPIPLVPDSFSGIIETIRRPFQATRHDELTVAIADCVKVIQYFDDGWAIVEKILDDGDDGDDEKKKNGKSMRGLIPIDCFRATGQDLSSFFREKRVSSNLYDGNIAYA